MQQAVHLRLEESLGNAQAIDLASIAPIAQGEGVPEDGLEWAGDGSRSTSGNQVVAKALPEDLGKRVRMRSGCAQADLVVFDTPQMNAASQRLKSGP